MYYYFDDVVCRTGTKCYKWDYQKGSFGTEGLLPFWVADSDFRTAPEIVNALKERVEHGIFGYAARDEEYFDATVNWMERRHGWKISKDWIIPLFGVVASMSFAIKAFTEPGDRILIQTPVYGPFFSIIERNRRELVENPLKFDGCRYVMDLEDLESKCASGVKMMLLCSPHNPVGRVWEREELKNVAQICKKYGILLVADEIHSDLIFKGYKHIPAGLLPDYADNTIVCTAASKSFNIPGLQASNTIISNADMRKRYKEVIYANFVPEPNLLGMLATQTAYDHSEKWLDEQLDYLETNLDCLMGFIAEKLPAVKVVRPEGTYLAWLDFREFGMSDEALMKLLIGKGGIALSNGTVFGSRGAGFMRFNFACPRTLMEEGLGRLVKALT